MKIEAQPTRRYFVRATATWSDDILGPFDSAEEAKAAGQSSINLDHEWPGVGSVTVLREAAFVSRHEPTPHQRLLAQEKGFHLVEAGDRDGFDLDQMKEIAANCDAIFVVNAASALNLASLASEFRPLTIGVFENEQRPENGKPTFFPRALHLWEATKDSSFGVSVL